MSGLPSEQLKALRSLLKQCDDFFSSHEVLRDLFLDERIKPWRNSLPERSSLQQRIEGTIAHLSGKKRSNGRLALPLFLQVLSEQFDEQDDRFGKLQAMSSLLESGTNEASNDGNETSKWNIEIIRQLITEALSDQETTILVYEHFRTVYNDFSDGMLRSKKIQLLIEYTSRTNQISPLLQEIKKQNPNKYRQFEAQLKIKN